MALSGIRVVDLTRIIAGPALGERTDAVLRELGYTAEHIAALRQRAVI